jgi:PAS domain-containing protein
MPIAEALAVLRRKALHAREFRGITMTSPKPSRTPDTDQGAATEAWQPDTPIAALDILSIPIMLADGDMIIRYVNPAATKMFKAVDENGSAKV